MEITRNNDAHDTLLTLDDVAREFNCSLTTVRRLVRSGELCAVRLASRDYRVRRAWIESFLENRRREATA